MSKPPRKRSRLRPLTKLALLTAALLVAATIFMLSFQRHFIFPRHAIRADPSAAARTLGLEQIWHESPEGRVEAWLLPGDGVQADRPGPAVIFTHGNGELIDHWPAVLEPYRALGVSVLLPEYRGYGRSAGSPSQAAITEDLIALYDLLSARPEIDPKRIIFHGRSLGGGAVCALAVHRPPRALVLESTFVSLKDLLARFFVPSFLVLDPFDNIAVVRELDAPTLLMHGRRDSIIPFEHAERLHRARPGSQLIPFDAGHNDLPPDRAAYWRGVQAFLEKSGTI